MGWQHLQWMSTPGDMFFSADPHGRSKCGKCIWAGMYGTRTTHMYRTYGQTFAPAKSALPPSMAVVLGQCICTGRTVVGQCICTGRTVVGQCICTGRTVVGQCRSNCRGVVAEEWLSRSYCRYCHGWQVVGQCRSYCRGAVFQHVPFLIVDDSF